MRQKISIFKFKDLNISTQESNCFVTNIKKIDDRYEKVPTDFYSIKDLAVIDENELNTKLYEDNDFIIPPDENGRYLAKVKLGKLYLEFCPGGKSTYQLKIMVIDKEKKSCEFLFQTEGSRHAEVKFENIIPFSLGSFYDGYTMLGRRDDQLINYEALSHAYEIREILKKLMLDHNISKEEQLALESHVIALFPEEDSYNTKHNWKALAGVTIDPLVGERLKEKYKKVRIALKDLYTKVMLSDNPNEKEKGLQFYTKLERVITLAFTQSSDEKISQAVQNLKEVITEEKDKPKSDASWGEYLIDVCKRIINVLLYGITLGYCQNFFPNTSAQSSSNNSSVSEESRMKLAN